MSNLAVPTIAVTTRHASSATEKLVQDAATITSSPSELAPEATSSLPPDASSHNFPNLDTISLDTLDLTPGADIPEQLGYLKLMGLDYGYGITASLQWVIEHMHINLGLPWWGSFVATAALIRLCMLPLYIRQSDAMARSTAITPVTKPWVAKMQEAQKAGDMQAQMAALTQIRSIRSKAGVGFGAQITPMILQGVVGFCGFRLIRAMTALPVPALVTEGPAWLSNLTLSDPYLILPFFMAGAIHLLVRMGGESGAAAANQLKPGMQKFMLYGMPGLIFFTLGFQPAALCLWFAAGGAIGITQALTLKRPAVRQFLGIAPIYTPTPQEAAEYKSNIGESAVEGLMGRLKGEKSASAPEAASSVSRFSTFSAAGKNAGYMAPVYQKPTLRRVSETPTSQQQRKVGGEEGVIDVQPVVRTAPIEAEATATTTQTALTESSPTPPAQATQAPAARAQKKVEKVAKKVVKKAKATMEAMEAPVKKEKDVLVKTETPVKKETKPRKTSPKLGSVAAKRKFSTTSFCSAQDGQASSSSILDRAGAAWRSRAQRSASGKSNTYTGPGSGREHEYTGPRIGVGTAAEAVKAFAATGKVDPNETPRQKENRIRAQQRMNHADDPVWLAQEQAERDERIRKEWAAKIEEQWKRKERRWGVRKAEEMRERDRERKERRRAAQL